MKKFLLYFMLVTTVIACKDVSPICEDTDFTYTNDVKTIIDANCNTMGCHNQGSENGDYTTYEGMEASFDGAFEERVLTKKDMPKGSVLNFGDLSILQCWMEQGFEK